MDVVDVVLDQSGIDEKFLGVTLFALVPNTTEFMNAMSFAINGNIALRCVIYKSCFLTVDHFKYGNRVRIRVASLLVADSCDGCLFGLVRSAKTGNCRRYVHVSLPREVLESDINLSLIRLIFPRWDVVAIILSIFLLTYTYIEAKSNYHRGSILILRYETVLVFLHKSKS